MTDLSMELLKSAYSLQAGGSRNPKRLSSRSREGMGYHASLFRSFAAANRKMIISREDRTRRRECPPGVPRSSEDELGRDLRKPRRVRRNDATESRRAYNPIHRPGTEKLGMVKGVECFESELHRFGF